jgi:hypothetical protein
MGRVRDFCERLRSSHQPKGRSENSYSNPGIASFESNQCRDRHAKTLSPGALRFPPPDPGQSQVFAKQTQGFGDHRGKRLKSSRGLRHSIELTKRPIRVNSMLLEDDCTFIAMWAFRSKRFHSYQPSSRFDVSRAPSARLFHDSSWRKGSKNSKSLTTSTSVVWEGSPRSTPERRANPDKRKRATPFG